MCCRAGRVLRDAGSLVPGNNPSDASLCMPTSTERAAVAQDPARGSRLPDLRPDRPFARRQAAAPTASLLWRRSNGHPGPVAAVTQQVAGSDKAGGPAPHMRAVATEPSARRERAAVQRLRCREQLYPGPLTSMVVCCIAMR